MNGRLWLLAGLALALNACAGQPYPAPNYRVAPPAMNNPAPPPNSAHPDRVPGEYLISLDTDAGAVTLIDHLYAKLVIISVRRIASGVYLLKVKNDPGPERMQAIARNQHHIRHVSPNQVYRTPPRPGPGLQLK